MVFLESLEEIRAVSLQEELLKEEIFGIKSSRASGDSVELPFLDYDKSINIAINRHPGDDISIVLDYRLGKREPRVLASDFGQGHSHCVWRVVAQSLDEFVERVRA